MQLKRKNGTTALFIAVLLTGTFAVAAAWHVSFEELRADIGEAVIARDPGYSYYPGFGALLGNIGTITDWKLNGTPGRPEVDTFYIDINPEDYRVLLRDRAQALSSNVLVDPHEIKAKIRHNGTQMRADVRLKGDLRDHWLSRHRMSLRIKVKKDGSLFGYNEFSIQKPASRQHPFDSVFQAVMRDTGNLSSVQKYVNVVFNGEPWGVMIMEEAMTSEYLEKLGRKESLVIRFSNEEKGIIEEHARLAGIPMYTDYRLSDDRLYLKMYEENKYAENPNFRRWYSYIAEQRIKGREQESRLYDTDAYGKALMVASIWNDGHPLWYANSRHYFNPYTLQLQPITTDAFIPFSIRYYQIMFPRRIFDPLQNNSVYNSILNSPQFQAHNDNLFADAADAVGHAGDYSALYHSYFPMDPLDENFIRVLDDNIEILSVKENRDTLLEPRDLDINYEGNPPEPVQLPLLTDHVTIRHFDDGRIEVYNLLPDTVHLVSLVIDGLVEFPLDMDIPPYNPSTYEAVTIQTNFRGLLDNRLAIKSRYSDQTRLTHADLSLVTEGLYNPLLSHTDTDSLDYLSRVDGRWEFRPGDWQISMPLVLDGNVVIPAGTTLHFAENTYLIVKGSIQAVGDDASPILMKAADESWKGIYVLGATDQSHWRNVRIENYTALEDGLLSLTGGITFYKSDVVMEGVVLDGAKGEDALNLVNSRFEINDLTILDTVSDGLDSDFSRGSISGSSMFNINGDALDFSGSEIEINDITARGIFDKAISVGEASTVNVAGGNFDRVGVALVSKDGSHTFARDLEIGDYTLAAAMSYQKKSFYDHPSLAMENVRVEGEEPYIRQTGSEMNVDGLAISAQDVDVDYLYENSVMKK